MTASKEGALYLVDRDFLGGREQGPSGGDAVVQRLLVYDLGIWATPTAWPGDGGYIYVTTGGGRVTAYQLAANRAGVPQLATAGVSSSPCGFSSSSPTVTSTGTEPGSALVWIVCTHDGTGRHAQLRAYRAVPVTGKLRLVGHWPVGRAVKFTRPTTSGGRVYIGTRDERVLFFGVPSRTERDRRTPGTTRR